MSQPNKVIRVSLSMDFVVDEVDALRDLEELNQILVARRMFVDDVAEMYKHLDMQEIRNSTTVEVINE